MTPDELPHESEPNRNLEQSETGPQTKPSPGREPAGKVENTLNKRNICPYLGLRDDRTSVSMHPTPSHVCFARQQRYLPSLEHQQERCLGTEYPGCQFYPDKKPNKGASNDLYQLQGELSREKNDRQRWPGWLAAAPLLIVIGTFVYAFASGLLPLPTQLAYNPVPTAVATAAASATNSDVAPAVVPNGTETPAKTATRIPTQAPTQTPTANSTENPTATSAPTLTLEPDSAPAAATQGAQPTARNNPNPTVVTPVATEVSTATARATATPTESDTATATESPTSTNVPTSTPTPPASTPTAVAQAVQPTEPEEEVVTISPGSADVGWWASAQTQAGQIGDSSLYAGVNEGQAYISAVRFDLSGVPRDATLQSARVRLMGLSDDTLDRSGESTWNVQVVAEEVLPGELAGETFFTLFEVPAAFDLVPNVESADVGPGIENEWILDSTMLYWLQQQLLNGATSVVVRIMPLESAGNALFAWDSGQGTQSSGASPELVLDLLQAPPTPTLP